MLAVLFKMHRHKYPMSPFCYWYENVNEDKSKTLEATVTQIIVIPAVRELFFHEETKGVSG